MHSLRKQRRLQLQSVFEPGFKQMLVVSLLLHLLLPALYYAPFFPRSEIQKPPVYRVNLVNKPVEKPQAGRPEAAVTKAAPKPKPQAAVKPKVEPKPLPPKPKPKPKPIPAQPQPQPKPEPKPAVKQPAAKKAAPQPQPAETGPSRAQKSALEQRLEQLRAAQEKKAQEEARKRRIADLKAAAAVESSKVASPIAEAPVGMIDGTGDEAGVSAIAFVREFIQQQWSFSKYQAAGNPEAEVKLVYTAEGALSHYRFTRKSGNGAFDESLLRAIAKAQQLPQSLPQGMQFDIVFNLKDMLER